MRRFIVCAATLWIAQSAAEPGIDRRTFVARAIRRSPTNYDVEGLPMARGLRPKTSRATTTPPPTTTTTTTTTPVPTRAPTVAPPQRNQGYPPQYQNYQYQHQQHPPFFNPFIPFGAFQGGPQGQQPMMVPVPVPVPYASMPGLPGIPNLMQPLGAPPQPPPTTAKPSRKSHKRHRYATLRPEVVEEEQMRSVAPMQEEIDAMDRNEVRRAPPRRRHQQPRYFEEDYSEEEETSTAATLFPTFATMAPMMKMPTLPPFTLPPSFEKLLGGLGITTPKPKKEKRRKEKRRREYEDEEEYEPVKRSRAEEESRPHGRSLAVEEDRGRRDPFEGTGGFEEQREEKESAPSVTDRLMRKGLSSNKKAETGGGEEDWLVPFRR